MFIRTERLFLRPGWADDVDELIDALGGDPIRRSVTTAEPPTNREQLCQYLEQPRDPRLPNFFMYLRGDYGAQLVGGIGLGRAGDEVELSYWIAPRHRGRGYALEAVRAVLEQARTLGHRRIVAGQLSGDRASERVLEAAGFVATGSRPMRFGVGRGGEAPARLYALDLERRTWPRMETPRAAMTA